jgi:hypothetical protein
MKRLIVLSLVLFGILVLGGGLFMGKDVQASTPVIHTITIGPVAMTGTTYSRAVNWAGYQYADVFYNLDLNTGAQTTTLKLQVSPDSSWWVLHSSDSGIVTATSDASGYVATIPVHGAWMRFYLNTLNNVTTTAVLKVVLR